MQTTPVRALGTLSPTGLRLLSDPGSTYRDGGEEATLRIVAAATDRSAASDEMIRQAVGWVQRYHVEPARSNIVRCLDLPNDARVLEIGAGCGAVTRYLGEQCALVDALEPVPERAEVARVRTADQPHVDVLVGILADVPAEPTYDVVVIIGVLEYVGAGTADPAPYAHFLADVTARLVDGGTLVLAIENRLGVKYLVGAPEDHTNRMFDSIEGYPQGGKARTFTRRELESLLRDSGLDPATRIAFPDYKLLRAVFGELPEHARSLLYRVPEFPSPDWRSGRARLADERSVWMSLVDGGLETEFGNSFLVLAGKGAQSGLWPATRGGSFFAINRRSHLLTRTDIDLAGGTVCFRRRALAPTPTGATVTLRESDLSYCPGVDLTTVLADRGLDAAGPLLRQWLELLDEAAATGSSTLVDLVPHNTVVAPDGRLHVVDTEFAAAGVTRDQVVRRGVFWLAHRVAPLAPPQRFPDLRTVGDLMGALGSLAALPDDGSWIDVAIAEESELITQLRPGPPSGADTTDWIAANAARMRRHVERPLADLPLGVRLPERARALRTDLKQTRADLKQTRADLREARAAARRPALSRADAQPRHLPGTAAGGRSPHRLANRLLPRGTRRGALARRLSRRIGR